MSLVSTSVSVHGSMVAAVPASVIDVRSRCQQKLRRAENAVLGRKQHRSKPALCLLAQGLRLNVRRSVAPETCVDALTPHTRTGVDVGSMFDQHLHDFRVLLRTAHIRAVCFH